MGALRLAAAAGCAAAVVTGVMRAAPSEDGSTARAHLRVAVLDAAIPGGHPKRVQAVIRHLRRSGMTVTALTADEIATDGALSSARHDALVLPDSPLFPVNISEDLVHFLEEGGDLALLGGEAFSRPLMPSEGNWLPPAEASRRWFGSAPGRVPLITVETGGTARWTRSSDRMEAPSSLSVERDGDRVAMRLELRDCVGELG